MYVIIVTEVIQIVGTKPACNDGLLLKRYEIDSFPELRNDFLAQLIKEWQNRFAARDDFNRTSDGCTFITDMDLHIITLKLVKE